MSFGAVEATLPPEAWVTALLSLEGMGPARFAAITNELPPREAWTRLVEGVPVPNGVVSDERVQKWRIAARNLDVDDRWNAMHALGISASARGASDYPIRLVDDLESPPVMYWRGQTMPDAPTVAIVGTRKCTSYGLRVAFDLGAALTRAGVSVVSGLALGIDASAHLGSTSVDNDEMPDGCWPVAVVGSGLDVIYPRRNRNLWTKIAERGVLFSEAPPGAQPEAWRFPARNRIIAALSDAVIVIESRTQGGSLLTVDEAQLRDVPVGAVPGPILSPSSVGTNQLLADGATPILGVDDVLAMIGHVRPRPASDRAEPPVSSELLETMGWAPLLFDQICALSKDPAAAVAMEVERLVTAGFCVRSGAFIERVR